MPYEFQVTRRVEFADTDLAGIMHFSNFFRFMETAEHAFLRSLGQSALLSGSGTELCLPRVHAACDYRSPLYFEDEVIIHLRVLKKTSHRLTYQFHFRRLNESPAREVAYGQLTVAGATRQKDGSLKAAPLAPRFAAMIEEAPPQLLAARSNRPAMEADVQVRDPMTRLGQNPRNGSRKIKRTKK